MSVLSNNSDTCLYYVAFIGLNQKSLKLKEIMKWDQSLAQRGIEWLNSDINWETILHSR